ncbi:MAG: hypothetical protein Kow00121_58740 [Elainellaceae cyanobacterium]
MPTFPPTHSTADTRSPQKMTSRHEYLEAYAEQDAILGSPNPRYKQSSIYSSKYLDVRVRLVGTEGLTDAEWDLTIF